MKNNDKIQSAIAGLLDMFKSGEIPEKIAIATNPKFDVPSSKWSLNNRLIQLVHGTFDSRGIRQWREAERKVKKGTKAIYILAPRKYGNYKCQCGAVLFTKDLEAGTCKLCSREIHQDEISRSIYFNGIPVFRAEDTEGKELPYENIQIPNHSFMSVAKAWEIEVKSSPFMGNVYGYYQRSEKIVLASPDEEVFYHELAHAAHHRLGLLKEKRQDPSNEIVAEFSAAALSAMQGKKSNLGNNYEYLEHYSEMKKLSVEKAVFHLLADIEKVLELIIETEEKESKKIEVVICNNQV
ncbi:antirestriction protein [Candidatus Woesearchaeota archaeon]|nr:antirestriction protein [Candidatus Woesearchaeota archaeon]